jgi:two-component system, NarL family, sensor histidine kinase UhpB
MCTPTLMLSPNRTTPRDGVISTAAANIDNMATLLPDPRESDVINSRILVVDDDAAVGRIIRRMLNATNYVIDIEYTASDCISRLNRKPYDVVLLDLDLPDMSGIAVLESIVAHGVDVAPILMTGKATIELAVEAMRKGAFDYVAKPPQIDELQRIVTRTLREIRIRRNERSLMSIVAEWTATFDTIPDCVLALDRERRIVRCNRAALQWMNRTIDDVAGQRPEEFLPTDFADLLARTATNASPVRAVDRRSGRHFAITVNAISDVGYIAIFRDLTALVRAESAQAALYRKLLTAQEDERGRIARELHDGVAQSIVSMALCLRSLAADGNDLTRRKAQALETTATSTLEEIRRLALGLRPRALDDHGLLAALEKLAASFSVQHDIRCELLSVEPFVTRLPAAIEHSVFRIVQEALANVIKHAHASQVEITVNQSDREIAVSIADNGCGGAEDSGQSMGLADMRERAELLNGHFLIESNPGLGTIVTVAIPLEVSP